MQDLRQVGMLSVTTFTCQVIPLVLLGLRIGPPPLLLGAAGLLWIAGTLCGVVLFVMFIEQPSRRIRAAGFLVAVCSTILSITLVSLTLLAT